VAAFDEVAFRLAGALAARFRADFAFEAADRRFGAADRDFPAFAWLVLFLAFALAAGFLAMMAVLSGLTKRP